ncbi:hypothetical protein EJ08DRAFT_615065 [Tothia fuscella]|uniref:ferric-chelate reductase (NADPH) n=1 Tax=Tothia fuscella TaxID=1048955 RepID=A0A9P4NP21_9PEZI|nr:hypothetical protein EJ08DRAFT_615065 [Tothia fuscella]
MGLFGYAFVDLTHAQKEARRDSLDLHAAIAQGSIGLVLVFIQLYFLGRWLSERWSNGDEERPSSPYAKHEEAIRKGALVAKIKWNWARLAWWCGEEIGWGIGKRGEIIFGGVWFLWLIFLCIQGTGDDYMHLTKRFGIIGASQLPFHYLLAMKSPYSPIQLLTRMSHEQLNIGHQILGRVIQTLLTLHAIFYLNFFVLVGLLAKRVKDRDVIIGLICISTFTVLGTAAAGLIRKWNYRVFYVTHVVGASALLPLLFFHVHHVRPFVVECVVVLILNVVLRTLNTKSYTGTLSLIPGTNLIQFLIPLSGTTRKWKAGQHVYLLPPSSLSSKLPAQLRKNPYTIASLPKKDGQLLLVARTLNGNTKSLAATARAAEMAEGSNNRTLSVEGPYGVSPHFPDFSKYDRILLVAGGVGATFIIPLWRDILESRHNGGLFKDGDVRLIWSVRKLAETTWAFLPTKSKSTSDAEEKELYITGGKGDVDGSNDTMEMAETDTLVGADEEKILQEQGMIIKHQRPNLREIVDETFSGHVGKVAVLFCGPSGMNVQLRHEVGRWVRRGKDVFYHAEAFGL